MSKKKNSNTYGRALIRDRFGKRKGKHGSDSFLHTSEMNDGYDWGRLNLQSVTEQSALDDFLTTAEMAGTEFTAERLNIKIIDVDKNAGIPSAEEVLKIQQLHSQYKENLSIPRRPLWDEQTTPEELNKREKESFLTWRRNLASLQEVDGLEITPYEKNLDFWRQLWRVIERSDLVVQIVDARNPLLFYCEDLEKYAKEVNSEKKCLLLVNKADFLSQSQRQYWKDYFSKRHIQVAFWSAKLETERQNEDDSADDEETVSDEDAITEEEESDEDVAKIDESESNDSGCSKDTCENASELPYCTCANSIQETMTSELCQKCGQVIKNQSLDTKVKSFVDRDEETDILSGEQLLDVFRKLKPQKTLKDELLTVGMVGYPNVGKSSTINAILHMKKVPVSSTPGRTKHFQTLCVDKDLMLCDCPGLVFPSFVSTKADLVINGILPIDQLRDHMPPVALICQKIPRDMLESCYSINLPLPQEGEDPERAPYAAELLNSYAYMRGFMTSKGIPDCSRAARIILKDFVSGKLVYCEPPSEISKETFQAAGLHSLKPKKSHSSLTPIPDSGVGMTTRLDRDFFSKESSVAHVRGVQQGQGHISSHGSQQRNSSISSSDGSMQSLVGKPWKKHKNNKKKEKLRKVFAHLDVTDKY